jgi:hypothetical protein
MNFNSNIIIGLDLDNTIIDYSLVYAKICKRLNLVIPNESKAGIKDFLTLENGSDDKWQEFQSHLYTNGLKYASVSNGLMDFLQFCRGTGKRVVIISHKTRETPKLFGGDDLRAPALLWLNEAKIVPQLIRSEDVFFCDEQINKIELINHLNCKIFVDDLEEIINHSGLNKKIKKILFSVTPKTHAISDFRQIIELIN